MNRLRKPSATTTTAEKLLLLRSSNPKTLTSPSPSSSPSSPNLLNLSNHATSTFVTQTRYLCSTEFPKVVNLFTEKGVGVTSPISDEDPLYSKLLDLTDELVSNASDLVKIKEILDSKVSKLFRRYQDGLASVELLGQLKHWPQLALEVFNWRKKAVNFGYPMIPEEYAKGIALAGRVKDVDYAVELFSEAANRGIKSTSIYNALMGAYMCNNLTDKSQALFRELKREGNCSPTIVTYNILLSIFGRLMLVDHMETTFREIKDSNLSPNLSTYNNLIAGYVTAWMWDNMERVFKIMEAGPIKPDIHTYLLMVRGYAISGKLEKMERIYELVKHYVNKKEMTLITAMICAYCKSSDKDRVRKIETLMNFIPEGTYLPWLNVLLIRLYAQENMVEGMEKYINEALEHKTAVTTIAVMRSIIAAYFRCNALERLINFVNLAESSEWRICRSLYHCKMVMLGSHNRLEDMENVLYEMKRFNIDPTKKTYYIMFLGYTTWGHRSKIERLLGTMCKQGYEIPFDGFS